MFQIGIVCWEILTEYIFLSGALTDERLNNTHLTKGKIRSKAPFLIDYF